MKITIQIDGGCAIRVDKIEGGCKVVILDENGEEEFEKRLSNKQTRELWGALGLCQ